MIIYYFFVFGMSCLFRYAWIMDQAVVPAGFLVKMLFYGILLGGIHLFFYILVGKETGKGATIAPIIAFLILVMIQHARTLKTMPVIENNGHWEPKKTMSAVSVPKYIFQPNVPPKLIREFEACECNLSELARRLNVNKAHIWNLFDHGEEPVDTSIRKKLFLSGKARKSPPAWVIQATDNLAELEKKAPSIGKRIYDRTGRRVR